jgi:glycosyltransferase involved in cell wall biosynthesis
VDHERTRVLAYNTADIFVHPATAEVQGLVIIESLGCGTPVVGYSVGGVPDMVRSGQSGLPAGSVNPETLAKTLERAIKELESGRDLRSECRALAEAEYGLELQAQRYLALFENLISNRSASGENRWAAPA